MQLLLVCTLLMSAILDPTGLPYERPAPRKVTPAVIRGRYDAAQTTTENSSHWANADELSARAAHSPEIRRILRSRARYELANSPLARGILRRMADYVVGTGPTLVVKTPDPAFNRLVQQRWSAWCVATQFYHKLWLYELSYLESGEAFLLRVTNPGHGQPVQLDARILEADQIASARFTLDETGGDGIRYDAAGNPVSYRVLRSHPGDMGVFAAPTNEFDDVAAAYVSHLFTEDRPGQLRGIPCTTSALPLFALRRRFMLAVVMAAEAGACQTSVLKTQASPEDPDDIEALEAIEMVRNMMLTLPRGWDLTQVKQEQPATTFDMFDRCLIREVGRAVDMPYGLAAADSSEYNFSSAKIDHQPFRKRIVRHQDQLEDVGVEPTFRAWWDEAVQVDGYLSAPAPDLPHHCWLWDGEDFLDPRESQAKSNSVKFGIETLPMVYARQGRDMEVEIEAGAAAFGMSIDEYRAALRQVYFAPPTAAVPTPGDDDEEEDSPPARRRAA